MSQYIPVALLLKQPARVVVSHQRKPNRYTETRVYVRG